MSRKGQIPGQILIYIMGLIIISLVVVFGYRAIKDFMKKSDDMAFIDFKTKLTNAVEEMSSDYGSVKTRDFVLPKEYSKICFVDTSVEKAERPNKKICQDLEPDLAKNQEEPLVCNYWKDESKENAFLIGKKTMPLFIGNEETNAAYFKIAPKTEPEEQGYLCINGVSSVIKLRIEGKGKFSQISQG